MKNLSIRERIVEFIKTLPNTVSVKAYGSSIGYQSGYSANEKKQVDLIVIVENIKKFYKENLKLNKYMYNFTPRLYFSCSSRSKLRKHAAICYTTDIEYGIDTYKMGVIEKKDVLEDLLEWKTYYIAGRFQKEMYTPIEDEDIEKANVINKRNALIVALILLENKKNNLMDLYEKICSLSYMGDNRNKFKAEDPNKIRKIASGSEKHFEESYGSNREFFKLNNDEIVINYDKLLKNINYLPESLKTKIFDDLNQEEPSIENIDIIRKSIMNYLETIIKRSSSGQTKKGILTSGPKNSVNYALEKIKKGKKK